MERYTTNTEQTSFWKFPEQPSSPKNKDFQAIRELKQAQSQLDLMKRRLSALRIKDEKNNRKSETTMKKLKYHQFLQQIEQRQRQQKQKHREQVKNRIEMQRNLNSSERNSRNYKLRQVRRMHQNEKHGAFLAEKRQSQEMENKIKQINEREMSSRRNLRLSVRQHEEQSRKNYQFFHWERQQSIRNMRDHQKSRVSEIQISRVKEIQQMARLEHEMLSRQSRSRQAVQNSAGQWNSLISIRKGSKVRASRVQSTGNTTSNPQQH